MRWFKIVFVVAFLTLAACSTSTGPQYPQSEENTGGERNPDKHGMVLPQVLPYLG